MLRGASGPFPLPVAYSGGFLPYAIAKSAVAVNTPADTTEDILATITIPANAIGISGQLRMSLAMSCTNNANVKTVRVRLGGIGGTTYLSLNVASSVFFTGIVSIANRGAANSQAGWYAGGLNGSWNAGAASIITSAIDTTAAQTIVITGQKATAGDTLTLESYMAELIYGA